LGPTGAHLKSWVLESSTDGNVWSKIDHHENHSDLTRSFEQKTFSIARSDPVHVIRLRQIDPNHGNHNIVIFTSFGVFGSVIGLEWSWSDLSPVRARHCTMNTLMNLSESPEPEASNEPELSEAGRPLLRNIGTVFVLAR
jgi:hypothetical protein